MVVGARYTDIGYDQRTIKRYARNEFGHCAARVFSPKFISTRERTGARYGPENSISPTKRYFASAILGQFVMLAGNNADVNATAYRSNSRTDFRQRRGSMLTDRNRKRDDTF